MTLVFEIRAIIAPIVVKNILQPRQKMRYCLYWATDFTMPHHEQKTKVPGDSAAKTRGTVVAARVRAKANKFTDEQRKDLVEQGMAIIYGGVKHAKSSLNRG